MKGRETGSPEHREAAEYIARHFKEAGLKPAGTDGYFQPVPFRSRKIVEEKSSLALVRDGNDDAGGARRRGDLQHAHRAGAEGRRADGLRRLRAAGAGGEARRSRRPRSQRQGRRCCSPAGRRRIPGPLLAHYQNTRWSYLKQAGAIGVVSIQNPKGQDIPWDRSKLARFLPSMAIADPALDETAGQQLAVTVNPATAEKFFEGSGHTFKELLDSLERRPGAAALRRAGVDSRDGRRSTRSR